MNLNKIAVFGFLIIVSSIASNAVTQYPDSNPYNATYHWYMDECSGDVGIDKIRGYNLSYPAGKTRWPTSPIVPVGSCSVDDVDTDNWWGTGAKETTLFTNGMFSLAFWMNATTSSQTEGVFKKWDNNTNNAVIMILYGVSVANKFRYYLSETGAYTANCAQNFDDFAFTQGVWYHIVMIFDPSTANCSLYINGRLNETNNCGNPTCDSMFKTADTPIIIGRESESDTDDWDGGFDDMLVVSDKLTQDEITAIYTGVYSSNAPDANNTAPNVYKYNLTSNSNTTGAKLYGYCEATDAENSTINYYYKWYRDGATNKSGMIAITNLTQISMQEYANISTIWGGSSTGVYSFDTNYFYINYSKPINATYKSNWTVKFGDGIGDHYRNYSINNCWNTNSEKVILRIYSNSNPHSSSIQCLNISNQWEILSSYSEPAGTVACGQAEGHNNLIDGNYSTTNTFHNQCNYWTDNFISAGSQIYEEAMEWNIERNTSKGNIIDTITVGSPGNYTFECIAGDNNLNSSTYTSDSIEIFGNVKPIISLSSNNFFSTNNGTLINNKTASYGNLSFTAYDDYDLYAYSIYIWNHSNGVLIFNYTNKTLDGIDDIVLKGIAVNTNDTGFERHDVQINLTDTHTMSQIPTWNVKRTSDTLTFDEVKITALSATNSDFTKLTDRYNFEFQYDKVIPSKTYYLESGEPINYQANSKYKGHFVIGKKWIDFEGVPGEIKVIKISDFKYQIDILTSETKLTFNSIGGLNENSYDYYYYLVNPPTLQWSNPSGSVGYIMNQSFNAILNISGYYLTSTTIRIWNSSKEIVQTYTQTNLTNGTLQVFHNFVNLSKNNYTLGAWHTDGVSNTVSANNVTLFNYIIDNCSATSTIVGYIYFFDEDTPTLPLQSTLELQIEYPIFEGVNSTLYNSNYANQDNYTICMYPPTNVPVYANLYFRYQSEGGFLHRYYLYNKSISNGTFSLNLYNFNTTTDISNLKVTTRYENNYRYYPDIVATLERRYTDEGIWRNVQMSKSDDYGLLIFHVIEQNVDYRITFRDVYNNVLKQTSSMKFQCTASVCDLTSLLSEYSESAAQTNLRYQWSYDNSTKNVTLTWTDSTGLTNSVRLQITKETSSGTLSICNTTKVASSGTIDCNLATITGTVLVSVYSTASPEAPVISEWLTLPRNMIGSLIKVNEGSMWSFAIMLTCAGFGIALGIIGALLSTLVGLIVIYFLGLLNPISVTILVVCAVVGIAIGLKVRNQ